MAKSLSITCLIKGGIVRLFRIPAAPWLLFPTLLLLYLLLGLLLGLCLGRWWLRKLRYLLHIWLLHSVQFSLFYNPLRVL